MTERREADDDLFQPTLSGYSPPKGPQPWRLGSQVYIAFFGTYIGALGIAILNAGRLGLRWNAYLLLVASAAAGLTADVVYLTSVEDPSPIISRAISLASWGGMYLVQRTPDRVYSFHQLDERDPYGSLVGPGIVAAILGFFVHGIVLAAVDGGS